MTRLNLTEACLLDLSGELGETASRHLHAHLRSNPRAMETYEQMRADFAGFRGAPVPYVPETEKARRSHAIKDLVHRAVRVQKKQRPIDWRGRLIYAAMASASGIAACLLVTVSLVTAQHDREAQRQQAIARAEESVQDFMNADSDNVTDVQIASLDGQIGNADAGQQLVNVIEPSGNRARLLELVDPTPDDEKHVTPGT